MAARVAILNSLPIITTSPSSSVAFDETTGTVPAGMRHDHRLPLPTSFVPFTVKFSKAAGQGQHDSETALMAG